MHVEQSGGITIYNFTTLFGFVELESFVIGLKSEIMGVAERETKKVAMWRI